MAKQGHSGKASWAEGASRTKGQGCIQRPVAGVRVGSAGVLCGRNLSIR